jgi:hypothetical protein
MREAMARLPVLAAIAARSLDASADRQSLVDLDRTTRGEHRAALGRARHVGNWSARMAVCCSFTGRTGSCVMCRRPLRRG